MEEELEETSTYKKSYFAIRFIIYGINIASAFVIGFDLLSNGLCYIKYKFSIHRIMLAFSVIHPL